MNEKSYYEEIRTNCGIVRRIRSAHRYKRHTDDGSGLIRLIENLANDNQRLKKVVDQQSELLDVCRERLVLFQEKNLDNLTADVTVMPEGETDMAKRMRHKLDINGKPQWISGTTQQELCEDFLKKSVAAGAIEAPSSIQKKEEVLFADYLWKWFNLYHLPKVSAGTSRSTKSLIVKHIEPFFRGKDISEISCDDIQAFFNEKKSLSKSTCHSMYVYLKKVFARAVKEGLISVNPVDDDEISYSQKQKKRRSLEEDQAADIVQHIKEIEGIDRLEIAFPFFLGIRRGEFLALRWEDFDFAQKTVQIERAIRYSGGTGNQPIISPTKNRTVRFLPIVPELEEIMRPFIKEHGFVFEGEKGKTEYSDDYEGTRFSDLSKPKSERQYQNDMKRIKKQIDLHGATAHVIRHTYATTAAEHGIDPKSLQGLMGHKRVEVTMGIYAETRQKRMAAAGMQLSGMYGRTSSN